MINIQDLKPSDISLILGMWEAIMGGGTMKDMARDTAETWCAELKAGCSFTPKLVSSRWYRYCDICLAVNSDGGVYALALEGVDDSTYFGKSACQSANFFVQAVSSL